MTRAVMVLSENWTLVPPRDLRGLVELAVGAERAGVDTVMLSEHVVLGPSAGAATGGARSSSASWLTPACALVR